MNRAATTSTLLSCMVLAVGGCHGRPAQQPTNVTTPTGTAAVVITADHRTARIPQPGQPAANAIRLIIQSVNNPSGQGLAISVAVESTATPSRQADVGSISTFPADQPGVFTLVLPAPAAELVHQGSTTLVITVSTALPGATLASGLRLSLTAAAIGP